MTAGERAAIEATIERLIDALDAADGDCDLEPDADAEPDADSEFSEPADAAESGWYFNLVAE